MPKFLHLDRFVLWDVQTGISLAFLHLRTLEEGSVGNLETKLMLTEENTRSSDPELVAMGCQSVSFILR